MVESAELVALSISCRRSQSRRALTTPTQTRLSSEIPLDISTSFRRTLTRSAPAHSSAPTTAAPSIARATSWPDTNEPRTPANGDEDESYSTASASTVPPASEPFGAGVFWCIMCDCPRPAALWLAPSSAPDAPTPAPTASSSSGTERGYTGLSSPPLVPDPASHYRRTCSIHTCRDPNSAWLLFRLCLRAQRGIFARVGGDCTERTEKERIQLSTVLYSISSDSAQQIGSRS